MIKKVVILFFWAPVLLLNINLSAEENGSHALSWEQRLTLFFDKESVPYKDQLRFFTYLYSAQYDAKELGSHIHDWITTAFVRYFFPQFTDYPPLECDSFDSSCAEQVLIPYFLRLKQEEANPTNYYCSNWKRPIPSSVAHVARWIPWTFPLPQPPPPLSKEDARGWDNQIKSLELIRAHLTPDQKNKAEFWAGRHGAGYHWRSLANCYLLLREVPEERVLMIRSVLMKGLYDGMIAYTRAKFTYCVPRPYMTFTDFKPIIPELSTPSYPSGHATEGSIFATILSFFFPQDDAYWRQLDQEGGNSRLWAGVHYPEDVTQGRLLGNQVGEQTLFWFTGHSTGAPD